MVKMWLNLKYLHFLILVFCINIALLSTENVKFQDSLLSSNTEISLLTFERGTGVANIWGHTGIRVKDDAKGIDIVFNYGTYDFEAPNFLMKFLRGKLDYTLSTSRFEIVERYYTYYKRSIIEQILNLDYEEKLKLYQLLIENAQHENKYYKYDFFYDNCSTRPMSIIEKSLKGKITLKEDDKKQTFRQLLDWQIWDQHWLNFGIDLIIGSKADKLPSATQRSFLPLKLKEEFDNAVIEPDVTGLENSVGASEKKLVKKENKIAVFDVKYSNLPSLLQPVWVFIILFLLEIFIFYFSYRQGRIKYKWYDKLWFIIIFAGSLIITFLWFFTDHIATKANWNIAVFNPLILFMLLNIKRLKYTISVVLGMILLMFLVFHFVVPQEIHNGVLLISGIMLLKVSKYGLFKNYFKN